MEPCTKDYALAIQEGTFSYHTVVHNQSFRSMDCTSSLLKKFLDKKFSCSRTKCEALVSNVFAPWANSELENEINQAEFVSLSIDTSNHGDMKLLPILIRYFNPLDKEKSVNVKLLEFLNVPGETSLIICTEILKMIEKYKLENKIVAMSADNANCNFGGLKRKKGDNVHTILQSNLDKSLLGIGCVAHIVHNSAHSAMNSIPIDIEGFVSKIFSYFHIYTVRVERLKDFSEFVGQEYSKILGHLAVRWLSLMPAVERILKMYAPLRSFFLSEDHCPAILKKLFEDPCTELWLLFIHGNLILFHDTIKMLEVNDRTVVESAQIMYDLRVKLEGRKNDKFVSVTLKPLLNRVLEEGGIINRQDFFSVSDMFYNRAIQYLNAWCEYTDDLRPCNCLLLQKPPQRDEIENAVQFLQSKCSNFNIRDDELFDEITYLLSFLSNKTEEFWNLPVGLKWINICEYFKMNHIQYTNLMKLSQLIMCLPGSNAPVERIFSTMNLIWTDQKNRLKVETVKAILSVKTNFNMSCDEFSKKLSENENVLRQIHSSDKYC